MSTEVGPLFLADVLAATLEEYYSDERLAEEAAGEVLAELGRRGYAIVRKPRRAPWEIRAEATGGGPCICGRPFWTHVCLGCSADYQTPGPGCVNCRNSGMDQTPCKPKETT